MKYCKYCGKQINDYSVVCPHCGGQVEEIRQASNQQPIVINNNNNNSNTNINQNGSTVFTGRLRNKWVALLLCWCFGIFGAHKFYEGKTGMGILYLCTGGLCGIGWILDCIAYVFKPNPYYV